MRCSTASLTALLSCAKGIPYHPMTCLAATLANCRGGVITIEAMFRGSYGGAARCISAREDLDWSRTGVFDIQKVYDPKSAGLRLQKPSAGAKIAVLACLWAIRTRDPISDAALGL